MKQKLKIISSTSVASFLTLTTLAQEAPGLNSGTQIPQLHSDRVMRAKRLGLTEKASDLIGMSVKNYADEKLGKLDDLLTDIEAGRIILATVSVGGFLGLGDTLVAVPPAALHQSVTNKVLLLQVDKDRLNAAPRFDTSKWDESSLQADHVAEVYRYYGEEPRHDSSQASESRFSSALPGHVQKATKLMGTSVKNLQDEKLGRVENLVTDLAAGRIVAVIISSGGFLGLGDELSAIPPTAMRFNTERDTLVLDISKEALGSAPHFKANQWPEVGQPGYADQIYRAYRVEPYFSTNSLTAADNTARNVRDRDNRFVAPLIRATLPATSRQLPKSGKRSSL
jgi:sporulation protein YlmC with PRC-barrel domain